MAAKTLEEIRIENEVAERQRARDREAIKAERSAQAEQEKAALADTRVKQEAALKAQYRARFAGSDEQFNEAWGEIYQRLQVEGALTPTRPHWAVDAGRRF